MTTDQEKQLLDDVAEIKRGMFGDAHLRQKGLVDRTEWIEAWIRKANLKIAGMTGAAAVVIFLLRLLWDAAVARKP